MQSIEYATYPKPGRDTSEDIVGHGNGFFWLLDGATPPSGPNAAVLTQVFLKEISQNLHHVAGADDCFTPCDLLRRAICLTRENFPVVPDHSYLPCATAIIGKLDGDQFSYLVLGDSYLIVAGESPIVIYDDRLKNIAVEERDRVRSLRVQGVDEKSDIYRIARNALISSEMTRKNTPDGYWIVSLDDSAVDHAITGCVTVVPGDTKILAASDGFARLSTHFLQPPDIRDLPNDVISSGASSLIETLRILEADRRNFRAPASSMHDDASFILVRP